MSVINIVVMYHHLLHVIIKEAIQIKLSHLLRRILLLQSFRLFRTPYLFLSLNYKTLPWNGRDVWLIEEMFAKNTEKKYNNVALFVYTFLST